MTTSLEQLLVRAARAAAEHRTGAGQRPVAAADTSAEVQAAFAGPLPLHPTPPEEVLDELLRAASGGVTATVGPRYFGFVIGGSLPAATAADILTTGWDQPAFTEVMSPAAAAAERVAGGWLTELLGLPSSASVGFVTGAQAANNVGLAVGRHRVLEEAGWDVERDGLIGAPRIRVLAGEERHATVDRALRLLGLGTASIVPVAPTSQGAIDPEHLEALLAQEPGVPTLVCLQAGNVNTGACDDFVRTIPAAKRYGAWVHVDGAFGLWAGASPRFAHLVEGVAAADSWGTDGHKWLNVPYDCGLAICADPQAHATTMSYAAAYLAGAGGSAYALGDLVPESSRRARGFTVWAALRELGRSGVADLVERCCTLSERMADRLREGGATIHNDVVLNQVLVGFEGPSGPLDTDALIDAIQRDGTCWVGGTTWHGQRLIRVSVSNWSTTEEDIDRSAEAILSAARRASAN